ncbi:MAG: hypothetical protein PHT50_05270 [Candidatus Omnitrophica bacterium]|nr:hypothetical protein [Candidatus Omnitrophota bacterium]
MGSKKIIAVFSALIVATTLIAFAAEEATVGTETPVAGTTDSAASVSAPEDTLQNENDMQWTWGEVVNLDGTGKTITLKYLDYETDQEKDITLAVDEKTAFENIKGFDEIKVKDTLSIDYTVGVDGKNIARNISLESPDSSAAAPAQAVENSNASQPAAKVETTTETGTAAGTTSEPVSQ